MKNKFHFLACLLAFHVSPAQNNYTPPGDTLVQQKLQQWQDLKFGLLMHWGTYSQWGVVESWSICPEDEGWTQRKGPSSPNYFEYKKAYEALQNTFNPEHFNPENWAKAAKEAGMRYLVFTTKHHDGFCMFDTRETDYKITSTQTPFSRNPRSNVAREIFQAFRREQFLVGAYFSKPDWHNENYWWSYFPPKDRNVNYDPSKYPERWNSFKEFTYKQIQELMTGYGSMDILWMDGGWVRPLATVDRKIDWQKGILYDQDIDMKKIAAMARSYQPGLIIVDRSVGGEFENYQTPEQQIPEKPLSYPWETCMTMGNSWSFVPNDKYKTSQELIQLLIKIVSRGGNFLLNIGPGPDGQWDSAAYSRLRDIGKWMKINSEAIYSSRPLSPYSAGDFYFTQSKDSSVDYVFYLPAEENIILPEKIKIGQYKAANHARITLLGRNNILRWKQEGTSLILTIPKNLQNAPVGLHAICFKIDSRKS
jgi:alpha-L-fucosidase